MFNTRYSSSRVYSCNWSVKILPKKKNSNFNFHILLGFEHEQARPDRDDYVEYHPENLLDRTF